MQTLSTFIKNFLKAAATLTEDIIRNRILNKNTPKGISFIVAGLMGVGLIDKTTGNNIIALLANSGLTYFDMVLYGLSASLIFLGIYYLWKKIGLHTDKEYIMYKYKIKEEGNKEHKLIRKTKRSSKKI
ncbi:hypothetical protein ABSA28_00986 [Candidatus Hepatincolaceae symbiont of Richtersius coronifer]